MDKNAIKRYAVWARRELMARVSQKARQYGITAEETVDAGADIVNGRVLSGEEKSRRRELVREVKSKGYEQTIEEAAYTWFNRFIALRFMEVNGCLPTHVRVFTDDEGRFAPQILAEAIDVELEGLDRERVYSLKSADRTEELYQYLLITQCNALNAVLPGMFRSIDDYMELLFPDNLLREGSVVERMISMIPQEDWRDQVQIIGWLYQYYNTEPKDKVFADLKKNIKVSREKIPAATQLFTPDWIVRYMVENSLGRLWAESHPNEGLKAGWRYYLEEAQQEPEVQAQLEQLRAEYRDLRPEEIKCIDPCMGSGHILVYMFDVLMQIYESCGWSRRDAVRSILEHNLYGLDVDDRAAQLAYFSVMMKAASYDGRFLRRGDIPQPNVYSPKGYEEGEELGSLLMVEDLEPRPEQAEELTLFDERYEDRLARWNFRCLLAQKYHVVVTNPPYMAVSNAGAGMQDYVKKNFPDSKADLFACFIERCGQLAGRNGYQAMITQHAWMFLSSFEKLRAKLQAVDTVNMAHLGARAFEEIGGEVVQTTSFVLRKSRVEGYKGTYCRLIEPTTQQGKEDMFLAGENRYAAQQANFSKIPGSPVTYWVNCPQDAFNHKVMEIFMSGGRNKTHNDEKYVRYFWEIVNLNPCWKLYLNGGNYRKFYGNNIEVVLWNDSAKSEYKSHGGLLKDESIDCMGIYWNKITSNIPGFCLKEQGWIFSSNAPTIISENKQDVIMLLGFFNSCVLSYYLKAINPTMTTNVGDILAMPLCKADVNNIVNDCICISKTDWDSHETSWDFKKHPLI